MSKLCKSAKYLHLTSTPLKKLFNILLEITNLPLEIILFQQMTSNLTGLNPVSCFANLFLFYHE